MAGSDQKSTSPSPADDEAATPEAGAGDAVQWSRWSNLWQIPAMLISAVLIGLAFVQVSDRPPPVTLGQLLTQAEDMISAAQFDEDELEQASQFLNEVVKPKLHEATDAERGQFHVLVADWLTLSQALWGVSLEENNEHIDEQFRRAVRYGQVLDATRLERWIAALIDLEHNERAIDLLSDLDALVAGRSGDSDAHLSRQRVYRQLIARSMHGPKPSMEIAGRLIDRFAREGMLTAQDQVWTLARKAELEIVADRPGHAIETLLPGMRRLESQTLPGEVQFGELYVLLARAYIDTGNPAAAHSQLQIADELLGPGDSLRGEVYLLLGRLAMDRGEHAEAFEHFDLVVRDFTNTPAEMASRLGRATAMSILGTHDDAVSEFTWLRDAMANGRRDPYVNVDRVVQSLVDRHDAALAMGDLTTALLYIDLAEQIQPGDQTTGQVLLRIASSNRQMGDDLHARWTAEAPPDAPIAPDQRHTINEHLVRAAEYGARHAAVIRGQPGMDDAWADSIWLAAESFELAGRNEQAVAQYEAYREGRSEIDPRYSEAAFRIGRAWLADNEPGKAVEAFEMVVQQAPRSPSASRSHVLLARSYVADNRLSDAKSLLEQVLRGERFIDPDAVDYRDALIEYGQILYENGEYVQAINHLDDAVKRYADDERATELHFLLADCYRSHAKSLVADEARLASLPPSERQETDRKYREFLRQALDLFDVVCDSLAVEPDEGASAINPMQREYQRLAFLYRGDCAFDLGDYEVAAGLYDQAARTFSSHHSSLVALIQIVNCYYALNDPDRARAAEQRVSVRLQQLPDEALGASDSLMDRAAWERWLANNPPGRRHVRAGSNGTDQ